ncbi:hypothetical protein BS78_01G121100 [Paspalum vaginatum]|nr:hypothetical protein BS78_01G121100 [Paspalum vaginatum]
MQTGGAGKGGPARPLHPRGARRPGTQTERRARSGSALETPRSADLDARRGQSTADGTEDRAGEAQRGLFATTFDDRSWFTAPDQDVATSPVVLLLPKIEWNGIAHWEIDIGHCHIGIAHWDISPQKEVDSALS